MRVLEKGLKKNAINVGVRCAWGELGKIQQLWYLFFTMFENLIYVQF